MAFFFISACKAQPTGNNLIIGAAQLDSIIPEISDKNIGLLVNHTSYVGDMHLVDLLLERKVKISAIFAPEHGFRGKADAGEEIKDGVDQKTGIMVLSLYGNTKKPSKSMMEGLDVVIFDIQDVGVRFYTYISTMHYMMEACAENGVKLIVLDRPNPNGGIVDGPLLDPKFKSFVGMHPIPVIHGLTVGELALMINGEGWLSDGLTCDLKVVPMLHWKHTDAYSLPIAPSPNLPNDQSVKLYPSLCFFEGTHVSIGRGTLFPFQVIGYPEKRFGEFSFTPISIDGMAKQPMHEGKECFGVDLRQTTPPDHLDLQYILQFYNLWSSSESFFTKYFDTLAGTDQLRLQIEKGVPLDEIRKSWRRG
ncbi:MAG: DUF1343 domain-containing protein [Cyclobacteriaceae bacterium]|nr:DUF1343 domain-containing protein [Cyclobacteriaceae bacterium]